MGLLLFVGFLMAAVAIIGALVWGIFLELFAGACIGWIAGRIMNFRRGMLMCILIGMGGSSVGHFLFGLLGFHAKSGLASLLVSIAGACIFIYLGRKLFGQND